MLLSPVAMLILLSLLDLICSDQTIHIIMLYTVIISIIKTLLDYIDLLNVYVWYSTVVI